MQNLFKIREIARFFGMTPRMLRHYEKIGLLKPAQVDAKTGYRYYDHDSYDTIAHISDFRYIGLGLPEISAYLGGKTDAEKLAAAFEQKIATLRQKTDLLLKHSKRPGTYKVTREMFPACRCVRGYVEAPDLFEFIRQYYGVLMGAIHNGVVMHPFIGNFAQVSTGLIELKDLKADVYIILADGTDMPDSVTFKKREVLRTLHRGRLGDIPNAYKALEAYARENGFEAAGGHMFVNLEGSYRDADSYIISEAILPVRKKRARKE